MKTCLLPFYPPAGWKYWGFEGGLSKGRRLEAAGAGPAPVVLGPLHLFNPIVWFSFSGLPLLHISLIDIARSLASVSEAGKSIVRLDWGEECTRNGCLKCRI